MTSSEAAKNALPYSERHLPRGEYRIYAHDYAGADPAFVLMHGFPDNLGIYDHLAPLLAAAGQRVVAFDFLGYGASDKPADYPYGARNLAGDLDAVVEGLRLGKVIPVAHDASGPTAIDWSLEHQDRVAAIALMNTYYDAAPTLRFPEFINLFADPGYRALATAFISDPAQFGWLLTFQGGQFVRAAPAPARERLQQMLLGVVRAQFAATPSSAPAFVSLTREINEGLDANTRRVPELSNLQRPVGLIWGAADPYLNPGVAEHLGGLFPDAHLTQLQAAHWPQIDDPEGVVRALLALRDRASGAGARETQGRNGPGEEVRSTVVSYEAVRLEIAVAQPYPEFCERFERAVPTWSRDRAVELVERKAPWSDVLADTMASAPHGFLLYWKMDLTPIMSLAGQTRRATEYLMGNHAIAETMYRHDPAVALYVPLRCAIHESDGGVRLLVEQPRRSLASLGQRAIAEVGAELDRKLAGLLSALEVDVPAGLWQDQRPAA